METKKVTTPEQEKLELAIRDFEEELRKTNKFLKDVTITVNGLQNKVGGFEDKLNNQTITTPEPDTKPVQQIVEKGIQEMKLMYDISLSKNRENNFQSFLKSDAKKWLVILVVCCLFLTYLYFFGLHVASK